MRVHCIRNGSAVCASSVVLGELHTSRPEFVTCEKCHDVVAKEALDDYVSGKRDSHGNERIGVREREEFFEAVWGCVLFTGGLYSDNPNAPSLYSQGNLPKPDEKLRPKDLEELRSDCDGFLSMSGVVEAIRRGAGFGKAGNDFHFTRNGHGCGFWDGDWKGPDATLLDKAAESFGSFELDRGESGEQAEEDEDGFFWVIH